MWFGAEAVFRSGYYSKLLLIVKRKCAFTLSDDYSLIQEMEKVGECGLFVPCTSKNDECQSLLRQERVNNNNAAQGVEASVTGRPPSSSLWAKSSKRPFHHTW